MRQIFDEFLILPKLISQVFRRVKYTAKYEKQVKDLSYCTEKP